MKKLFILATALIPTSLQAQTYTQMQWGYNAASSLPVNYKLGTAWTALNSGVVSFTQTGTGAVQRTVNSKLKDYKVTPQDFSLTAGNGGDDTAAIQAAINAVIAAGGGTVYFPTPSSGNYNICGGGLSIVPPAYTTTEMHLEGNGEGLTSVRIAPTCAAPPLQMLYILDGYSDFANPINTKSKARISISHLRLDGYCKATYNINNAYSVQLSIKNSVLRNVKVAAGSANYYQAGGYETSIDDTVRLENINDVGNTCYSAGSLPDYNLKTSGTDSHYKAMAVGAKVANFYQMEGGNNDFSHSHGWGYGVPNADNQPDSRPQYNYFIRGSSTIVGAVADSFTLGGFYLTNVTATGGNSLDGGQLIGARCMGVVDANSSCITVDNTTHPLINWVISGNNTQGITTAGSPIKIIGALNASTVIRDNTWSLNSTPVYIGGGSLGTQSLNLTSDAGNSYVAAAAASGVGSADANLKLSTNGTGGVIQHLVAGSAIQTIASNQVYFSKPISLSGSSSGTIVIAPQAAAGTYNFNLPTTAGTSSYLLTSAGGGSSPMTWTSPTITVNGTSCTLGSSCTPPATSLTIPTTVSGTVNSGGVPYFNSSSQMSSSGVLSANAIVIGGGAGAAPTTTSTAAGILTFLGTPSSANLAAAVTDETGSGALVFATSPTLVTPILGVASGTSLALGGATIGANALAVTGTTALGSSLSINGNATQTAPASATLQLGAADAVAPAAQTLQAQSVVTGTPDTAGANLTINASRGTGLGNGGAIIFRTAKASTISGPNQNSLTARLQINQDGSIGMGTSDSGGFFGTLNVGGTGGFSTGGYQEGIANTQTFESGATTRFDAFLAQPTTGNSATYAQVNLYSAVQTYLGSGSTITNQNGFFASAALTGATNNYAFYSDNAAAVGAGKTHFDFYANSNVATGGGTTWGFYENGTANNAFRGNSRFGGITAPTYAVDVTGDTNTSGVFRVGGTAGLTATKTVRDSAGTGTCTLIFTGGILTGGTC